MMGHTHDPILERDFDEIASALESRFRDGTEPWPSSEFEERAFSGFRHQFETCETYRLFCSRRGIEPGTVASWEDVPAVPATAFKYYDFISGPPRPDPLVFRTSGTTRGSERRGRHVVLRPDLYRAALLAPFEAALFPHGPEEDVSFLSLIPPPTEAPDSSLSFMVGEVSERLASRTSWLVDGDGALDVEGLRDATGVAEAEGEPVLLLGTAAAFVHLLEIGNQALSVLPEGSRVMETGGFKGARRAISRAELYQGIAGATGLPTHRIVNEYGMTELLSQLYEPVLSEGAASAGEYVAPPWLRVRALDPTTLRPVGEGVSGILAFFDLANLASVSHILTEDIGTIVDGRVRLEGRAQGAEPRGCSRAMDDLMTVAREGR
jgi:hypothetical protein